MKSAKNDEKRLKKKRNDYQLIGFSDLKGINQVYIYFIVNLK